MKTSQELIPMESELIRLSDHHTEEVLLARETEPRYFGGVLGRVNQRAVWVYTREQAQKVLADRVHLYQDRLGVELETVQI